MLVTKVVYPSTNGQEDRSLSAPNDRCGVSSALVDEISAMLKRYGVTPIDRLLVLHPESADEHTPQSVEIVVPVDWSEVNALITRSEGQMTHCSLPAFPHVASMLHHGHPAERGELTYSRQGERA